MSLVSHILEAAWCNGTHHKLAFHALDHLKSPKAEEWRNLFLSQHAEYLRGSKAPDKEFKDFKNHVLHVRGNLWGGAPELAQEWFQKTVAELKQQNWSQAAFAAGVLSHYLTDPLMPFHTQQSEAETNIHRAYEWSVAKTYDLMKEKIELATRELPVIAATNSADWLADLVVASAQFSNQGYEILIEEYDFKAGVKDPPTGLNQRSRDRLAVYLGYAQNLHACVLDRALEEAAVDPPKTSLTAQAVLASLEIPIAWVTRKMTDGAERKLVKAMYDEFTQTGVVDKTLTDDVRVIRDYVQGKPGESTPELAVAETKATPSKPADTPKAKAKSKSKPAAAPRTSRRKNRVTLESELAAAPSIGKRTAAHFSKVGVTTVGDFVEAEPIGLAEQVGVNYITAEVIQDWQDQARLACELPQLRGHDVQILVGGGIRSLSALAETEPEVVLVKVQPFVESEAGKRVVKAGNEPTLVEVEKWVSIAEDAVLAA